ncbi:imidazole glycerol phosphate synthase subunit HisH [Serpentinicella sp. ANB-PHB4]|uniref:imidazole glycerol phosphate synthase subunit HisH n=1 Tax=Serpentinicella sp. ANB-PHB4 TaxID=3074076 RepID=UPI002859DDDD|nr:imidazole glycerol phosphate synthase subunit HisH [Serpentinicella sp. ANB-PHB4]MDR5659753.1 imidazole glycerol phosphate synthase subunit HisH [Serpentinicella sp. ANB-PHB4]
MIAIVNYGMGNLRSVQKAFETVGLEAVVTHDPEVLKASEGIVIPGVGAFYDAMENIKTLNLEESILEEVSKGKPFLGICLGMQILFDHGYEVEKCQGLGLVEGDIVKIPEGRKVPHMGWNQLNINQESAILKGITPGTNFYFVHSYYAKCHQDVVVASTDYKMDIPAIVQKDNVWGIQFHPEKSGKSGLKILKNFGELI